MDRDDDEIRPGRLGERYCAECDLVRHAHGYSVRAGGEGFTVERIDLACDHELDPDETISTQEKRDLDDRGDVQLEVLDADE